MDYEKGTPRNLVQFSEYNDLAFTDTGITINDNSKPNKNVIWTSDKIEKRLEELVNNRPVIATNMATNNDVVATTPKEYYPNGYKVYKRFKGRQRFFRVMRPSWWLSFIIPNRQHYCDKCCNYLQHTFSTEWNDDPKLANTKCSGCNATSPALPY